jgi:hypothetical protein
MTEPEAVARTVVEALKPAANLVRIAEEAARNAVEEALLPAMTGSPGISKAYEKFLQVACGPFVAGETELQSQFEIELSRLKGVLTFVAEWNKLQTKQIGKDS